MGIFDGFMFWIGKMIAEAVMAGIIGVVVLGGLALIIAINDRSSNKKDDKKINK